VFDKATKTPRMCFPSLLVLRVGGSHRCNRAGLRADVEEDRLQKVEVDGLGATEGRELEPHDQDRLEGKVPGDIIEEDAKGEAFQKVEEAEDHPVGEPLDVVMGRRRLDSLEGQIGWETPPYEI